MPSLIESHMYSSATGRQESQCVCGLARSAHADEIDPYDTDSLPYRCPYCVDREIERCHHGRPNALDLKGERLGPAT